MRIESSGVIVAGSSYLDENQRRLCRKVSLHLKLSKDQPVLIVLTKRFAAFAVLAILMGLLAACGSNSSSSGSRPNVVMIIVDTLRRDHLGCYGHSRNTSPHIDALAEDGTRYLNAYSQAPWTTPSIGSILTSLYPSELRMVQGPNRLEERFVLLSELLRSNGYSTHGVVSNIYLSKKWNFHQGFDDWDESQIGGHTKVSAPGVTRAATRMLEEAVSEGAPFFLFAHYFDPHYNYIEHDSFPFASDMNYQGTVRSGTDFFRLRNRVHDLTNKDLEYMRALYDSEVALTDEHIGRLLARMRELKVYDDSLIVFLSDHGEEFYDHRFLGHTRTLYDELVHVPLIIKWPRTGAFESLLSRIGLTPSKHPAIGTSNLPVPLVDLYPTLARYLEIRIDHPISGVPFDARDQDDPIFTETSRNASLRAVVRDGYKLVRVLPDTRPACDERFKGATLRHMLFDLEQDPGEIRDLLAEAPSPAILETFQELNSMLDTFAQRDRPGGPSEDVELSEEERQMLESLGYIHDQ